MIIDILDELDQARDFLNLLDMAVRHSLGDDAEALARGISSALSHLDIGMENLRTIHEASSKDAA